MVKILAEEGYTNSIWCIRLIDDLTKRLRYKRIAYRQISSLQEATPGDGFIYLIGSDYTWLESALQACNAMEIYPILLCNQAEHTFDAEYSTVCLDIVNSMRHLVAIMKEKGHRRIALYGVNPKSVSDLGREKGFLIAQGIRGSNGGSEDVFLNTGSLKNCFEEFYQRCNMYDSVICVNEFAAVSLARRLQEKNPQKAAVLRIISCADGWLSQFYRSRFLSMKGNFEARAKAAVELLENLKKNPDLSHIIMKVRWDFSMLEERNSHRFLAENHENRTQLPQIQDEFYEDEELREMMQVERLLRDSEQIDRQMLWHLLKGDSYDVISQSCFLTESTIKYRIKKMLERSGFVSRHQMIVLLKKYLPTPMPERETLGSQNMEEWSK